MLCRLAIWMMGCSLTGWLLGSMLGCAGSAPYGSFLSGYEAVQAGMAEDAAGKVRQAFPPEQHTLQMKHPIDDPFGHALVNELRGAGYSVVENYEADAGGHRQVGYVVDQLEGTNMLRVQLLVDARRFSRAYMDNQGSLQPMGAWAVASGAQ